MNIEETKLIKYFQIQFVKTYLCKPPLELLQIVLSYHRIAKAFEKALNNITIQLNNSNSNLNIQLQQQINMMNNNTLRR